MKRGLAGLIAVLLLSGFVAVGAGPSSSSVEVGARTNASKEPPRPSTSDAQLHSSKPGHDHVHVGSSPTSKDSREASYRRSERSGSARGHQRLLAAGEPGNPCGIGLTAIYVPASTAWSCYHQQPDLPGAEVRASGVQRAAPVCFGNGVNGHRVQAIYAFPKGSPNRADEVVPYLQGELISRVEGIVRLTSAERGREIGVRWYMPGCELSVAVVELPAATGDNSDGWVEQTSRIDRALAAKGYDSDRRKYLVWFDGPAFGAVCGAAPVAPDDTPLPTNWSNGASPQGVISPPNVAVAYRESGSGRKCWGSGTSGARTETHELFHSLGAVQPSSPNSDREGHCLDGEDILCSGDSPTPRPMIRRCFGVEVLDCNGDDYFNPRPAVGSYLSTHWNTANSFFLGSVPLDLVPIVIPDF